VRPGLPAIQGDAEPDRAATGAGGIESLAPEFQVTRNLLETLEEPEDEEGDPEDPVLD
jgi:hypothetical protein